MAEASLKSTLNNKKRRVDGSAGTKSKKAMQTLSSESLNALNSITDLTLSGPVPSTSSGNNSVIKKTYHLGGTKYMVLFGQQGMNEEIHLKEWDEEKVTREGVRLNISRFIMILHNIETVEHALVKIMKGEPDVDIKIHIGGSYYMSCNSPYRSVGIRMWKTGSNGELFPTKVGLTLNSKEFQEFSKYGNKNFSDRMELFTYIPCLLQPDREGHNKFTCVECMESDAPALGEVDFDIPL